MVISTLQRINKFWGKLYMMEFRIWLLKIVVLDKKDYIISRVRLISREIINGLKKQPYLRHLCFVRGI